MRNGYSSPLVPAVIFITGTQLAPQITALQELCVTTGSELSHAGVVLEHHALSLCGLQ